MRLRLGLVSKLLLVVTSSAVMLIISELGLRLAGFPVGYLESATMVEQLEVYPSFVTDDEGVFKANPNYDWPSEYRINSDGFRSIELVYHDRPPPRVVFLGDSFTWGASAEPITESFADRVAGQGYVVYNLGVPGTDPVQYAFLAEKYVPLLKPDVVAVMLCMSNDLRAPMPMVPNKNLFHVTNAGWLYAFNANGKFMTAQEAYEHYVRLQTDLSFAVSKGRSIKGRLRPFFLRSALGSQAWFFVRDLRISLIPADECHSANPARPYLERIKRVSSEHGAEFILFLIPTHPQTTRMGIGTKQAYFGGLDPKVPDSLTVEDYMTLPNGHFNNSGHRKFAEFVLRVLTQQTEVENWPASIGS